MNDSNRSSRSNDSNGSNGSNDSNGSNGSNDSNDSNGSNASNDSNDSNASNASNASNDLCRRLDRPFLHHLRKCGIELLHLLQSADGHANVVRPLRPAVTSDQDLLRRHRRVHLRPGHPLYRQHEEVGLGWNGGCPEPGNLLIGKITGRIMDAIKFDKTVEDLYKQLV